MSLVPSNCSTDFYHSFKLFELNGKKTGLVEGKGKDKTKDPSF